MNCTIGTGGNAKPVKVAFGMVDNRLAINQAQGAVWADLDTLPGTATFFQIDDNFHWQGLADGQSVFNA